jgi:predicted SAM-dependent methyltransferase
MALIDRLAQRNLSSYAYERWLDFRDEVRAMGVYRRGVKAAKNFVWKPGAKLNIGSGTVKNPGFTTVDFCEGVDVRVDLRRPMPIPNGIASLIICEHFLEHLRYPGQAGAFLKECHRILGLGGELYISVPDTRWPLECYVQGDPEYVRQCKEHKWHPAWMDTEMEHINFHFRQQDDGRSDGHFECHRFAYDEETLLKALRNAGFAIAEGRSYDPAIDAPHRRVGSLFVKAVK